MGFIISSRSVKVFLFISLAFALTSCKDNKAQATTNAFVSQPADTIFIGGPILTIKPVGTVEALAVRNGLIVAVGNEASAMALKGPATKVINLNGKTLMPGFVEPHLHLDGMAMNLKWVNCGSEQPGGLSIADVKKALAKALPSVPANGWLIGNDVDPSRTTPLFASLSVDDLDEISTTVPIFVLNASGHIAYVNHKAYQLAGISEDTPNPQEGTFSRDANGHLNGQLLQSPAFLPFVKLFPKPDLQTIQADYQTVLAQISQKGVTTAGDLNTGLAYGLPLGLNILQSVAPTSPVRIRSFLSSVVLRENNQSAPVAPFSGDDKLKVIGIKFTLDGSVQGFTAALKEPYLNSTQTGELVFQNSQLLADMQPFFDQGWAIAVHCNGDKAIDQALDTYQALLANTKDPAARRLRLEHFTVANASQVKRVKELGLTVSMTIPHVYFWGQVLEQSVLGAERAERIDPAGSLKAQGTRISFNSDSTFTTENPLRNISTAVMRIPQLNPPDILGPDQRITIDDALQAMTLDAAYQLFIDDKVGSLEVGKYADVIVLAENPRTVDPSQLASIKITDVYLAGVRQGSTQLSE